MRYLLLLAFACTPDAKPKLDAGEPFGLPCVPNGQAPLSTCGSVDGEIGWCVDDVCYRGCINGACQDGGTPTPVYNDCYCK